jgi:prevent-host-death family protein
MEMPVITVGAFDAKTHLSSLLERVERGEEILITRHGKAIARLVPAAAADRADVQAAIARMKELRARTTLGGLSWKELRDEGRR